MGDLEFVFEFVLSVAALTMPVIVGIRLLAGGESTSMPWPRGVQEEEPKHWNAQLFDRPSPGPRQPERERGRRHRPLPLTE
jgi:hypothetical protein